MYLYLLDLHIVLFHDRLLDFSATKQGATDFTRNVPAGLWYYLHNNGPRDESSEDLKYTKNYKVTDPNSTYNY